MAVERISRETSICEFLSSELNACLNLELFTEKLSVQSHRRPSSFTHSKYTVSLLRDVRAHSDTESRKNLIHNSSTISGTHPGGQITSCHGHLWNVFLVVVCSK